MPWHSFGHFAFAPHREAILQSLSRASVVPIEAVSLRDGKPQILNPCRPWMYPEAINHQAKIFNTID